MNELVELKNITWFKRQPLWRRLLRRTAKDEQPLLTINHWRIFTQTITGIISTDQLDPTLLLQIIKTAKPQLTATSFSTITYQSWRYLNTRELVKLVATKGKQNVQQAQIDLEEQAQVLGLNSKLNTPIFRLSAEWQNQLYLLAALAQRSRLITIDLPWSDFNDEALSRIKRLLEDYANNNEATVLLIGKQIDHPAFMAKNLAIFNNKQLYFAGSTEDFMQNQANYHLVSINLIEDYDNIQEFIEQFGRIREAHHRMFEVEIPSLILSDFTAKILQMYSGSIVSSKLPDLAEVIQRSQSLQSPVTEDSIAI